MKIRNRRFIGSKARLLEFIYASIRNHYQKDEGVFADLFAGTGVVSEYFSNKGFDVLTNDTLYSNYINYETWLSNSKFNIEKIIDFVTYLNNIDPNDIDDNYFSNIYGNKYYSINDAKKIGYIRDLIENKKSELELREYYILLTSLLYTADKIANTVGHFEHFLSTKPKENGVVLSIPEFTLKLSNNFLNFNKDANELVKEIKADIVYLDPPYNARQYINFYHVLENLARWDKPQEFEGISMKFKRNHLKSNYSRSIAKKELTDLIDNINSKIIAVSYNNTYSAKSSASNNKIQINDIIQILETKGKTTVYKQEYKHFNSGKTNFSDHAELLFVCEVGQR